MGGEDGGGVNWLAVPPKHSRIVQSMYKTENEVFI